MSTKPPVDRTNGTPVIYAVDDEHWSVDFWLYCKADHAFPGVKLVGADNVLTALGYAARSTTPTLYVIDCRMPSNGAVFSDMRSILQNDGVDIDQFRNDDYLTGVFAGMVLKRLHQGCRVILLTAYSDEVISKLDQRNVRNILDAACDGILDKKWNMCHLRNAVASNIELLTATVGNGHGKKKNTSCSND